MTGFARPMPVKTLSVRRSGTRWPSNRIVIQYSPSTQAYVFYPRVLAPRTLAG